VSATENRGDGADLHGRPTAAELLDAVVGFLREDLMPVLESALRHQVRIAAHAVEVVRREVELAPEQNAAHFERLRGLGFDSDAALAAAIRDGAVPDSPLLRRALTDDTRDRLRVANPRWLPPE
jgi:Domain of unknown function (DUF6285)